MAISVGTTFSSSGASVSSLTYSVTVAATANNVLVVTFCARAGGGQTIQTVSFNGVNMTQAVWVSDAGGSKNVAGGTYYAIGVAATTANVVVTMSSSCQALYSEAVPFYGAGGIGTVGSLYNGATAGNTDAITTLATNSYIVGSAIKSGGGGSGETLTDNASQTTWGKVSLGTNPNNSQSAAAYKSAPTIGSYSIGWTWTANTENVGTVIEVQQYVSITTVVMAQGSYTYTGYSIAGSYIRRIILATGTYALTGFSLFTTLIQKWVKQTMHTSVETNQSKSPTIIASYNESNWDFNLDDLDSIDALKVGMNFMTTGACELDSCKFFLNRRGSPAGNIVATLYSTTGTFGVDSVPTGSALATSQPVDASTLNQTTDSAVKADYRLVTFPFTGSNRYKLQDNTAYVIAIEYGGGGSNDIIDVGGGGSNLPAGNPVQFYSPSGPWSTYVGDAYNFYVYAATPSPWTDQTKNTGSETNQTKH